MVKNELKQEFDRAGYVVSRNFLLADDLLELREELQRYISTVVPTLPQTHRFYDDANRPATLKQLQHMDVDPFFRDYLHQPSWKQFAEELLGEEANASGCEWFNKPPGTSQATPPHQDNYYFNLSPPSVVTLWLALDDIDEENGCLRYLAGSHMAGRRAHGRSGVLGFSQALTEYGPAESAADCPIILRANDLVAHHGWTIHRADANQSRARNRRSFAMVFRGVSCRIDQEGQRRYEAGLAEQHKELGLHAR